MKKSKERKLVKVDEKNITWNRNHLLIMETYDRLYEADKKVPSLQKVADECGLSFNTVQSHSESLTLSNVNSKYKLAGERVTKSLLKNIEENGKAAEVKLYNQLVFGYKDGIEHTGKDGKDLINEVKITIVK